MTIALKVAWRVTLRHSVVSGSIIAFIALAIGATTAMFAVVNQVMFKPPAGVHDATTLFRVTTPPGSERTVLGSRLSLPEWDDMRSRLPTGLDIAVSAHSRAEVLIGNMTTFEPVLLVSSNYFEVLGVRPLLGKLFAPSQAEDAAPREVILAEHYWERVFRRDTSIIGRLARLNGIPYHIIGVAGGRFTGIDLDAPSVWVPVRHADDLESFGQLTLSRDHTWLSAIGRRPASMPVREVSRILTAAVATGTEPHRRDLRGALAASDIRHVTSGTVISPLRIAQWLLSLAIVLCAMAAVNVGALLIARGYARRDELAIRSALGSSPLRLVRELGAEATLLVAFGGAGGVVLTHAFLGVIRRTTGGALLGADWRVIAFTIALLSALTLVATLLPALGNAGIAVSSSAALRTQTGTRGLKTLRVLLAVQFSFAILLASATALLVKRIVTAADLGLAANVAHLAIISTPVVNDQGSDPYMERLEARLREIPGVQRVSRSATGPMQRTISTVIAGPRQSGTDGGPVPVSSNNVAPGWFATVGMPIVRGRDFDTSDTQGSERVAIVNQTMAQRYWGNDDVVDRCIPRIAAPEQCAWRVVGVVSDANVRRVGEPPEPQFYRPIPQGPPVAQLLVVRTERPVSEFLATLRTITDQVAGSPRRLQIESVGELVREQTLPWRRAGTITFFFAILAVACVSLGIVAVGQFLLAAGRREMAVRLALGATAAGLMTFTLWQRGRELLAGALLGWGAFVAARGLISDPLALGSADSAAVASVTTAVLVTFAVVMTAAGCRGLTRIDPAIALREI